LRITDILNKRERGIRIEGGCSREGIQVVLGWWTLKGLYTIRPSSELGEEDMQEEEAVGTGEGAWMSMVRV
jgi:hypothetical protein